MSHAERMTDGESPGGARSGAIGAARPASPEELAGALRATGYLADDGLATVAFLALAMHRPLFSRASRAPARPRSRRRWPRRSARR